MMNCILRCGLVFALASACSTAQNGQSPHFEVASVKPVSRDVRMGYSGDTERMAWARIPLTNLIADAYRVGLDQITGPDWLTSEFYAINVKLPQGSTKEEYPQMMANLLAERFGMVVHRVTKEVSGYELTVSPGGPKLTASNADTPAPDGAAGASFERPKPDANGFPILTAGIPFASHIDGDTERLSFRRSTMAFLASRLQSVFSRSGRTTPVADRTGITGRFDFQLAIPAPSRRLQRSDAASDPDAGPGSISAAMEKQLGLKLKAVKTSLDFIVVGHAERVPTAN